MQTPAQFCPPRRFQSSPPADRRPASGPASSSALTWSSRRVQSAVSPKPANKPWPPQRRRGMPLPVYRSQEFRARLRRPDPHFPKPPPPPPHPPPPPPPPHTP